MGKFVPVAGRTGERANGRMGEWGGWTGGWGGGGMGGSFGLGFPLCLCACVYIIYTVYIYN